jgi:hypothetical protein
MFLQPRGYPHNLLDNSELGGVALNDPSQGLQAKTWRGYMDGDSIMLEADGVTPTAVVTDIGITEFQFTFDQNMRPFVCWVGAAGPKFYWYDTNIGGFAITALPADAVSPRCAMDDKRLLQSLRGANDIILAYVRAGNLYFRAQRERYQTENLLMENVGGPLVQVGMNLQNRFQFLVEYTPS